MGTERYDQGDAIRNPNLDPDPHMTPDPDICAVEHPGVEPGQTPPESNSATATVPSPPPFRPPKNRVVLTVLAVAVVLMVLLVFIGYIAGILA